MKHNLNTKIAKNLLAITGLFTIFVAIIQALIMYGIVHVAIFNYFGASTRLFEHGPLFFNINMVVVTLLFIVAGLYGLSGARLFWRLPWQKKALILIGILYLINGLWGIVVIHPSPTHLWLQSHFPYIVKLMTEWFYGKGIGRAYMFHDWLFAVLFIVCGIAYLYGASCAALGKK